MTSRQSIQLSTLTIAYLEWGAAGLPPVLLLHGLADHARVWQSLGETLSDRFHLIAPDLPGHGDSIKPDRGYDSAKIIAVLEDLMDHLGWKSAHILGHSWTGKIACIWATHHPNRFRSMVIVDPIFVYGWPSLLRITFPLFYKLLPFLQGMGPFETHEAAIAQAKTLKQYRAWTPWQQQIFEESIEAKPDGTWSSKFSIAARNGIFDDVLRVSGLVRPVDVPTLLIQPERGVNCFDWQLKPYRRYLTDLKIQPVPSHHWAFLTDAEPFNRAVSEFLMAHSQDKPPKG
ncbi:alpha/beta hydrolase [filamentous cyanobacterium CCP5]|nr:alpha/beta hydrolase [filamentous cyanobacterium CCT1]PSN19219.1 alpha/beta hydrolase [filamentous cyanobacterium CCP5]